MAEENKFAVFHWGGTDLDIAEGVYLFETESDAEQWMEAIIRKFNAADTMGKWVETRDDVIAWFQDGLDTLSYFHCYPVYEVPEP